MELTPCNLCGSDRYHVLYADMPDLLLQRPSVHSTLVRCDTCGLVYQNPRPTLSEMAQHYPPEYEPYSASPPTAQIRRLQDLASRYGVEKRCHFITARKPRGRLLDLGCSTGVFLLGMRSHPGWELYGVDINAQVAAAARRNGLDVFAGTVEEARYPDEYFDAITLWDVLEHLHDPSGTLRELHRILKPDGLLLIRVPNLSSRSARIFGPYWAGLDQPRHLFVFSPTTLRALLDKAGFLWREGTTGSGAYPTFLLSVDFWARARWPGRQGTTATMRFLRGALMRAVTVPIFYLDSLYQRGPLLVVLASKREPRT